MHPWCYNSTVEQLSMHALYKAAVTWCRKPELLFTGSPALLDVLRHIYEYAIKVYKGGCII